MNVTIEEISQLRKKLHVSFSAEETENEQRRVLRELSRSVSIPGFRPGKAPEKLIRHRYAKELGDELKRVLLRKAFEEGIKESGVEVHQIIDLDDFEPSGGEEASASIVVDLEPEFETPDYGGIPVEVEPADVADEAVEEQFQTILKQRADFSVVERAAQEGDYVKVSYEGRIGDEPIADLVADQPIYGKQQNTWEEAGATEQMGVEAVVNGIIGMAAGDSREASMTFPEDFSVSALAGKEATYQMEVHEVRERVLPEIDEAFLKSFNVESEGELRANILDGLEEQKQREVDSEKRRIVSESLRSAVEFPLPESRLEQETQSIMREIITQNMRQGVGEEEFEKHKEEIFQNARQSAEKRVKLEFILQKVAAAEEIAVQDEDIQRYVLGRAYSTREKPQDIVKELQKDSEQLQQVRRELLMSKALDFVVSKATVTEKSAVA